MKKKNLPLNAAIIGIIALFILTGSGFFSVAQADIISGLVGHWTFDDGSGTTAADSSTSGYTGTLEGSPLPAWTTGKIGGALSFNGSTNGVSFATPALTNQFTIAFWARRDGAKVTSDPFEIMVGQNGNYISPCYQNKVLFDIVTDNGGAQQVAGGTCASLGAWAHYAGTYDGSVATLYMNGTFIGSLNVTGNVISNFVNLWAGCDGTEGSNCGGYNFNGTVDDLRVYNRALSGDEVTQLYLFNPGGVSDNTPPSVPTGLSATPVTYSQISLSWTASTDDTGVAGYVIYRNGKQITTTADTTYLDTGLSSNTSYAYTVAAYDGAGNISDQYSPSVSASTLALSAEDFYIAEVAQGKGNGTSYDNAYPIAWLNQTHDNGIPTNWANPKQGGLVGPGDTIHLCGTITEPFTIFASGTAGKPITVIFEQDAKISVPWLPDGSTIINMGSNSYITIDGGVNGVIEATDVGTTLGHQVSITAIGGSGLSNIVIKNLTIQKMYQRTPYSTTDDLRAGYGICLQGSDILIENNTLSDGDCMIGISGPSSGIEQNIRITGNNITKANHGMFIEAGGQTSHNAWINDMTIDHNRIDNLDVWGGVGGNHLDGMILSDDATDYSGGIKDWKIYDNYIGPNIGGMVGGESIANTGGIWFGFTKDRALTGFPDRFENTSQIINLSIFNNILSAAQGEWWSNGFILAGGYNVLIANNTCLSWGGGTCVTSKDYSFIYNNLNYDVGNPVSEGEAGEIITGASDYNVMYGADTFGAAWTVFGTSNLSGTFVPRELVNGRTSGATAYFFEIPDTNKIDLRLISGIFQSGETIIGHTSGASAVLSNSGIFTGGPTCNTLSCWQAITGLDMHSTTQQPLLDANNVPMENDTAAVGKGVNLSSYLSRVPELGYDYAGNLRPANGNWDIGAYQYGSPYGDVSENGEITAYDAALTVQYAGGVIMLTHEQVARADVLGNGVVTACDAAFIAQKAVGLIK